MKNLLSILLVSLLSASAYAQVPAADAVSCEAKAVSKDGKPLSGAAKASSIKKCEAAKNSAADKQADCEAKAIGKNGKPLAGAARDAFLKKCAK